MFDTKAPRFLEVHVNNVLSEAIELLSMTEAPPIHAVTPTARSQRQM